MAFYNFCTTSANKPPALCHLLWIFILLRSLSLSLVSFKTQGSKIPCLISFSFHNNKLQSPLKTAMDTSVLDQCVSLSIPDERWDVLGQKKPHLVRIKLFYLNRWKMHTQQHRRKGRSLNYCYNSLSHAYRSLTRAKLSTCYHTTHPADQSLGFLYSPSYLCPSVVSCLILSLQALWGREHFLPCV